MNKTVPKPRASRTELRKTLKRIQALFKQNRLQDAKPFCDTLYAQDVRTAEFLHLYGLSLRACGDFNAALIKLYEAHEASPHDAKVLNSLGLIFLNLNDVEAAITMFKRATSEDQKYLNAWENLGLALRSVDRFQSAELAFTCAHFLDQSRLDPIFNLALLQVDARKYAKAAEMMDELLANHKDVTPSVELRRLQVAIKLEDLAYVEQHKDEIDRTALNQEELADLDRVVAQYHEVFDQYDEAIAILEAAAARKDKRHSDLISHLGYVYGVAGQIDEGIETLKGLLETKPDHNASRYNLSLLQFRKGEIEDGFKNYETRWQFRAFPSKRRHFDAPLWRGEPLEGKNILVWREQGIGDEVRFASLLPELYDTGCQITFECSPKLMPLWQNAFPWATIRPEGDELCTQHPDYAQFDFQIPIGSLGGVFRTSLEQFEAHQRPWIARNHNAETQIRSQLAVKPDELLIGVCWRSMNQIASRDKVFLNCEQLEAFKAIPNARWLNVQYASTPEEISTIREKGLDLHHYTDLNQTDDLVGACTLLGACDLVISVGGSVGDLAGGVGTPMIYMTREMSEAFLGTDHVPWFTNCKSYPIPAYKSDETIQRIVADWPALAEWAEGLKPEDRKRAASPSSTSVPLDLTYPLRQKAA
ncbi:MAG: tetratricopeptide repeat protein [Pseudomonadota bacterium]